MRIVIIAVTVCVNPPPFFFKGASAVMLLGSDLPECQRDMMPAFAG